MDINIQKQMLRHVFDLAMKRLDDPGCPLNGDDDRGRVEGAIHRAIVEWNRVLDGADPLDPFKFDEEWDG
jgi:hypothetical protein